VGKAGIEIERKEIFGPVMLVIPYDTVDEAVEIANGSRFGFVVTLLLLPPRSRLLCLRR
jgi:acyl-CoA reductase-like NAD-dependent aldehyde dehydrogenase